MQKELPLEPQIEKFFKLPKGAIFSQTKKREISLPRKIAQYLQVQENLSRYNMEKWSEIAAKYPGRGENKHLNHATVMSNVRSVQDIMSVDKKYRNLVYKCQVSIWGEIKYKI